MQRRILEVLMFVSALVIRANAQTPVITSQPQSITNNNASTATFTVVAANAATYQWQLDSNSIPGATNSTYTYDNLTTNQAGSYTVMVGNANGTTNSQPATLTVVQGTILQWTISTYPDGSSSNFLVQLFDHDKPATVENFIHYITSGSYSNTFFERDAANFVLQGGDYVASDRMNNGLHVQSISTGTNIFPSQVDSEFNVGPLIHNEFGTLAMALTPGETNSATSAFFFNLADNSANLDRQDLTVFGRILSGSNILQYFNTLSAPSNGIYPYIYTVTNLPVNYHGTNEPTDANFFYCDFAFQTTPPVDTTPPTVSITFPAPNASLTNVSSLTVQGTAQDNVGLAEVFCVLTSLAGANDGESQTNAALGTTHWSLNLGIDEPGVYQLTAYAQDGAGNLSAPATEYFTNLAILSIITNVDGELTTNEQYLVPGQQYSVTAAPGAGELFLNWQNQGMVSLNPVQSFTAETNFALTVTFLSNTLPPGLTITSPAAGSIVLTTNAGLTISGTLPSSITVTQLTCQLFSQFNAVTAALPAAINGTNWSLAVSHLVGGPYTIVVVAKDSLGQEGFATESFTALVPPIIISQPTNLTVVTGSSATFTVVATNAATYQWYSDGTNIAGATNSTLVLEDVSAILSGSSYIVVVTSQDGETVTSTPAAVLTIVTGTMVQITFSGFPDGIPSNVIVQLFDHEKPATVANFIHYITSGAYSNMFFDRDIPNFVLQGGDYDATDRTNGTPPVQYQSINSDFTLNATNSPRFAAQVDNEFGVGPLISNTFGTLAMAKSSGHPDSAANAFVFNLADNSAEQDNQDGGFTVFGRVISGSNVLQYFNTLSKPDEGIFDSTTVGTNQALTDLPVNYHGWGVPANSNLFFADFKLLSTPNVDTTPPIVTVIYPTNGQTVTNADVIIQGTASDNVAVANVICYLESGSVFAIGATNWAADFGALAPGHYTYYVAAQDGAGNFSAVQFGSFVVPRFPFESAVTGNGGLSTNLNGTNTTIGSAYSITAKPGRGAVFVNWTSGTNASLTPTQSFRMQNGLQVTANFISNTLDGFSLTYPAANAQLTNATFSIKGAVTAGEATNQVTVTCQVFSASTSNAVTAPMVVSATKTWATPSLPLAPGYYIVQAVARDDHGRSRVVTEKFTLLAPLTVITYGSGTVSIRNGTYLEVGSTRTIIATPSSGQSFLSWNAESGSYPKSSVAFEMTAGLTLTATFVSNVLPDKFTFTYPKANAQVTNANFNLTGKIASSVASPQVVCQLFLNDAPLTDFEAATVSNTNWTLPVSNLGMGSYTAVAIATDGTTGKTALASESFVVNFYPNIAGAYNGLFFDPANISGTNAGSITLELRANGFLSGLLTLPHQSVSLNFYLGPTGNTNLPFQGESGTLRVSFDVTNFSGQMTGFVELGNEVCPLTAYRQAPKLSTNTVPSTGKYVLNLRPLNPSNGPAANGFAALTMETSGTAAVAVTLADDTSFSFSTGVATNGVWPLFKGFYNGYGMLIGWETNLPSGECMGTLYWAKAITNGNYYTNGVQEVLNSVGANYVPPPAGAQFQIVFGSDTLPEPLTNSLTAKIAGQLGPVPGSTDKLLISLLPTGVITGSILNTNDNKTLKFSGVFLGPSLGGSGFILDTDKTAGVFVISPM